DIDAQHLSAKFRLGHCRGAIATPEIQHVKPLRDSKPLHKRLAAFPHGVGNAREIAFFPECFVRISRSIHKRDLITFSFCLLTFYFLTCSALEPPINESACRR